LKHLIFVKDFNLGCFYKDCISYFVCDFLTVGLAIMVMG